MTPEISISTEDRADNRLAERKLDQATTSLRNNGYLIVRDLVDPANLENLRVALDDGLQKFNKEPEWIAGGRIIGHLGFTPPAPAHLIYEDILINPFIKQITRSVLGDDVRNVQYSGNTNLPGSVAQMFHSDTPVPAEQTLLVNIPLGNVSVENGAIEIIPKTHTRCYNFSETVAQANSKKSVHLETNAGDALIRFPGLLHRGTPNRTSKARHMLSLWYVPKGSEREKDTPPISLGPSFARWAAQHDKDLVCRTEEPACLFFPNYFRPGVKGVVVETFYRIAPKAYRFLRALRR